MADLSSMVTDEITDQIIKILKDKTVNKLLAAGKLKNLSDADVQKKLRDLGFTEIANDPKLFRQFKRMTDLPASAIKGRFARLLAGVGSVMVKSKITKFTKDKSLPTRALAGSGFAVFRGAAKDYAQKSQTKGAIKRLIEKPELMKNIAKSLQERNLGKKAASKKLPGLYGGKLGKFELADDAQDIRDMYSKYIKPKSKSKTTA